VRTVKLSRPDLFELDARYTLLKGLFAAGAVAPHTSTVRVSLAVPAGSRGVLLSATLLLMRDAASTTAGLVEVQLRIPTVDLIAALTEITGAVGTPRQVQVGRGDVVGGGQTLEIVTADASVGGSYLYRLGAALAHAPVI
jgi:hypothetical protein